MSADPKSPKSLFAAAQDSARQLGLLKGQIACEETSRITSTSYVLNDSNGVFIARVPLTKVRQTALMRYRLLTRMEGVKKVAEISALRQVDRRTTFRKQPDEVRALAWALSEGRRVPLGAFSTRDWIVGLLLLLAGLLPGFAYFFWAWRRHLRYKANLDALVMRWRGQKRPDPSDAWFKELGNEGGAP